MLAIMSRKACALPDISNPTSNPSCIPNCFCTSASDVLSRIDGERRSHLSCQVQPERIHVGDDDVARASMADHWDCHDADWARSRNQYIFAVDRERKRRMHGVAKGIKDRGHFLVDLWIVSPDVCHGQAQSIPQKRRGDLRQRPGSANKDAACLRGNSCSGRTPRALRR